MGWLVGWPCVLSGYFLAVGYRPFLLVIACALLWGGNLLQRR
jgi:hypothetical protein